ncbi:hypothetical protein [Variovorax guangxiensis]|uniref:hypothetical protein n=1 Tax=Variovorax guangxiensis TaxID=1775474 RepID=UPI0011277273|nr:hypothetical protein [Variovorax guangxiensis]
MARQIGAADGRWPRHGIRRGGPLGIAETSPPLHSVLRDNLRARSVHRFSDDPRSIYVEISTAPGRLSSVRPKLRGLAGAAVVNALADAIGAPSHDTPLTHGRVLAAINPVVCDP